MQIKLKIPTKTESIFSIMSRMSKEYNAINLAQGFPDFDCDPALIDLVYKHMVEGKNQYAPMPGVLSLREQIAEKFSFLYGVNISPASDITITAGATQAIFTAIGSVVRQDDEVILLEPAYDSYLPSIKAFGGQVIPYRLSPPDYTVDWDALEKLITHRTTLIIINNPHNPSAQVFSDADMMELSRIANKHNLFVLSDEVYEHIVFDGEQHTSIVKYPELYKRSFATFSFGKVFHNTGWKMGYCVAPQTLMKAFRQLHEFNVFSVNTPVQFALADYLKEKENYTSLSSFFQQKRDFFVSELKGSKWKIIPSRGSYFQLLDYSDMSSKDDISFANYLCQEIGVGSIPTSPFYSSGYQGKVLRFCFAKKEETLLRAIALLKGVI